jgi:hypothetical protein
LARNRNLFDEGQISFEHHMPGTAAPAGFRNNAMHGEPARDRMMEASNTPQAH